MCVGTEENLRLEHNAKQLSKPGQAEPAERDKQCGRGPSKRLQVSALMHLYYKQTLQH